MKRASVYVPARNPADHWLAHDLAVRAGRVLVGLRPKPADRQGAGSAYVHAGGQFEWDSAAPVAVAVAHGLRVRRLDGSPPRYNRPDPALPDIVWAALDAEESR
jgi:hypothetical protein